LTAAEQGLLLLCCKLEDDMLPLTMSQYRRLRQMVHTHHPNGDGDRTLTADDLMDIGCGEEESRRILLLLSRRETLQKQMRRWEQQGIEVCTRLSPDYPARFRFRLGDDAPPVLFLLGDRSLLRREMAGVVGSRNLLPEGRRFAEETGRLCAEHGIVLVSGNARGADKAAQDACLRAGGDVIAVVADRLTGRRAEQHMLYLSEEIPERGFSTVRALRRNRLIHAAGFGTFAAQVRNGSGGTWDGTVRNLQAGWSPVCVCADGSSGAEELTARGATPVKTEDLYRYF